MITYYEQEQIFLLQTARTSYAFIVNEGMLVHLYWGKKILCPGDLPSVQELLNRRKHGNAMQNSYHIQEYACWGYGTLNQNALKVTYASGSRNAQLLYTGHSIDGETLKVLLSDPLGMQVELTYTLYPELDIINRSARIINNSTVTLTLENAFSATVRLPYAADYRLTHLAGAWGAEYQVQRQMVQNGCFCMETRTGFSGATHLPMFLLDENGLADELHGTVYFGTLQWSGHFRMIVEKDEMNRVSVTGGISDFDFSWPLQPGEDFETPVFTIGWTDEGFSGSSRLLHRYQRNYLMRKDDAERLMPAIVNGYGTFWGAINEEKIMSLVDKIDDVGAEALLIDAGWSGRGDNYQLGMGDWNINPERFPGQLKNIADALHAKGKKFGLWVEPEMAHTDSQIVKEHPDWILRYPDREPIVCHVNRVVLNFGLDEVWQDILAKTIKIIETCDIDYYKMDFNRNAFEYGAPGKPDDQQKTWHVRYVRNLYKFYDGLIKRFPNLMIENCAGGGQRVDLAMTRFSGRINRSDNQDPLDILKIHEGFTYLMLSKFAGGGCHISKVYTRHQNSRISSTRFQAHVAMMGSLAIGENLKEATAEELAEIKGYVEQYKQIRRAVQHGEVYRLASAWNKPYAAFEYVLPDQTEAALFVFGQSMQFGFRPDFIRLGGLDADAMYEVEGFGIKSGAGLMNVGLFVPLEGDMDSRVISIRKVNA